MVSAVPPDFEITLNSVRAGSQSSRNSAIGSGSTLSSTKSRGASRGRQVVEALAERRLQAVVPSAEPPMPSTTILSKRPARAAAYSSTRSRTLVSWGRSSQRRSAARRPCTARTAARVGAASAPSSASVIPCSGPTASASKFV